MCTIPPDASYAPELDCDVCVCAERVPVASSPSPSEGYIQRDPAYVRASAAAAILPHVIRHLSRSFATPPSPRCTPTTACATSFPAPARLSAAAVRPPTSEPCSCPLQATSQRAAWARKACATSRKQNCISECSANVAGTGARWSAPGVAADEGEADP